MKKYFLFLPLLLVLLGAGCNPPPPQGPSLTCTDFEYSDWSLCVADGTQHRTVIKALPEGCIGGNPIIVQDCKPLGITPPPTCTKFEYSEWSSCSEDGKQYRTITKTVPPGCSGGYPIQSQKCEYKPTNVGTAPEILARMINQIRTAPNQTIESSYVSEGNLLQKLSYRILDNSLVVVSTLIHRDTNVAEPTVDFIDSNLDGFVDYWAKEDRIPHLFDKKSQEYTQIQTIWGIYLLNFVNYHLTK